MYSVCTSVYLITLLHTTIAVVCTGQTWVWLWCITTSTLAIVVAVAAAFTVVACYDCLCRCFYCCCFFCCCCWYCDFCFFCCSCHYPVSVVAVVQSLNESWRTWRIIKLSSINNTCAACKLVSIGMKWSQRNALSICYRIFFKVLTGIDNRL